MIEEKPSGLQAALVGASVRLPRVVLALACALLVFGLSALAGARFDVFPEFTPPTATIQTEAPGLDPEQVEVLVTQIVKNAFSYTRMGYASAMSWVLFIMIFIITFIQFRLQKRWVYYENE